MKINDGNSYAIFFCILMWLILNTFIQCESSENLKEIKHRLYLIETEVSTLKYYTH